MEYIKSYDTKGRHIPKCKHCNKQLKKGDECVMMKNYYYCMSCGWPIRLRRIELLEGKLDRLRCWEK